MGTKIVSERDWREAYLGKREGKYVAEYSDGCDDQIAPDDVARFNLKGHHLGESMLVYWQHPNDPFVRIESIDGAHESRDGCGACCAGILIMNGNEIQKCDDCAMFDTDEDAAAVVNELLLVLGHKYREGEQADALDRIKALVLGPISAGCLCYDYDGNPCHVVEVRGDRVFGHSAGDCEFGHVDCRAEVTDLGSVADCVKEADRAF